ncbi:MAG: S8 family serine peptidase, partial [bacterium]
MAKRFLLLFTLAITLSTVFATDLPRHESELLNFSANPFLSSQGIPSPALPELEFTGFERDFGYYIVQFSVPLDNSVREKVIDIAKETPLGAQSFGYIPDNAIVYRLSKKYLDEIRALPEVRWVGPLEPQFRVRHVLFDEDPRPDEDGRIRVNVKLFSGENIQDLIEKLGRIEFEVVESGSARLHEFVLFSLEPQSVREFAIIVANHEATQWAERRMPKYPNNDWSRWFNQSYSTSGMGSVGAGWYAQMTADATKTPIHIRGIYGEGQLVGSSDTGVDSTSIYFCDPGVAVSKINYGTSTNWTTTVPDYGHRKIRAYSRHTVGTSSSDYADEDDGHGSHVNGSIGGNNEAHNPPNTTFDAGDGMAPLCRLTFSDLANSSGSLIVPSNLSNTILKFAYNHGARLHTNSWGSRYTRPNHGTHPYNDESADVDEFTWFNKDFLIFFSAGNSNTDQGYWYPPDGINGEGLGKNIVTVGAAESGSGSGNSSWTNPGSTSDNNPEDNAIFSSHGPSSEWMMKPNLTACGGWYIFSAGAQASGSMCHTGMTYMGGTSMSSPTTAGLAALVREYYEDGFYPTGAAVSGDGFNPSAALVKATLQASCRNMTGAY